MTDEHPNVSELERYVIGAGTADEVSTIEAHVATCATCATALAREAVLEVKLQEVAHTTPPIAVHRTARRVAIIGGLSVLAFAAALLILPFARPRQDSPDELAPVISVSPRRDDALPRGAEPSARMAGIACIDPVTEDQCKRDARRRGLAMTFPTTQVPRYEYAAADQLR